MAKDCLVRLPRLKELIMEVWKTMRDRAYKMDVEVTDPISDHCGVHVNLDICPANYPKSRVSVHNFFDYKHADWDGLRTALVQKKPVRLDCPHVPAEQTHPFPD